MRKITKQIVDSFINGKAKSIGNSSTDGDRLYLHGHCIAKKVDGQILISNAGWATVTTKERLNGFLNALGRPGIFQRDWQWYRMSESCDPWKDATPFPSNQFVPA